MSPILAVVLVTLVVVILAWGAEIHHYADQASRNRRSASGSRRTTV